MRRKAGHPGWITEDGFLDPLKLPLGPIVTQALDADDGSFRTGCTVLATMAAHGGREAGVVLLGLLAHYRDDPARGAAVVNALGAFVSRATIDALTGELYRLPSTNATRGYLNTVLNALTRLPREMWEEKLTAMSEECERQSGTAGIGRTVGRLIDTSSSAAKPRRRSSGIAISSRPE